MQNGHTICVLRAVLYVPGAQSVQLETLFSAVPVENVPAGQNEQAVDACPTTVEYRPAPHDTQVSAGRPRLVEYLPATHQVQVELNVAPSRVE